MDEKRNLFKQVLSARYVGQAVQKGVKRLIAEKALRLVAAVYLLVWGLLRYLVAVFVTGVLADMRTAVYRIALAVIFVGIALLALWRLGTPKDYLRVMFCMTKVPALANAAGEIPIFLSATPADDRAQIWEFESYGVPPSAFVDVTDELESSLDIALVAADSGNDGRKVLLTVVPHPGPWPKVLPWDATKLLPPENSVVALGENRGQQVLNDFSVTPHLLIAGQTGSGKSVLLKGIMLEFMLKSWTVYLVDYKRGADYGRSWEKRCTLTTEDGTLLQLLEDLHTEMERRLDLLHDSDCPNIEVYNAKHGTSLARIALCFDEIAEALEKTSSMKKEEKERKEVITYLLGSLARLGRAPGIHLILATQRGSAEVLNGQIRSNVQAICGIANENLSLLTLGTADAHKRIPKTARGRFLTEDGTMFQGYFCSFEERDFPPIKE